VALVIEKQVKEKEIEKAVELMCIKSDLKLHIMYFELCKRLERNRGHFIIYLIR
jgi:hypothetical protein